MLYEVITIDLVALHPHGEEDPVEKAAGLADKRLSPLVLFASRRLADEDQPGVGIADAEDDVAPALAE